MTAPANPHGLWFASFIHQDGTKFHALITSDTEEQARAALAAHYGQLIFSISELVPLTLDRLQDLFELDPDCPLVITLFY
jgi:hypothetical protein